MWERIEQWLDEKAEPSVVDDPGFWNDIDTVFECYYALREFQVLPEAGGWLDQEESLTDDLLKLNAMITRRRWEQQNSGGGDVLSGFLNEAGSAPDVDELFHG